MAGTLGVKQGISAPAVRNIPEQWSAAWFRRFITDHLQNGDTRNTNAAPGVSITGSEQSPGTVAITPATLGGNPTALVGLTPINGTAITYIRSDGAPALNQAIAPTWTGNHTFNGPGTPITINAASGQEAIIAIGAGIASMEMRAASGFTADYEMWNNGAIIAFMGTAGGAGQLIGGSNTNDLCISTSTAIRFASGATHTQAQVLIDTTGAVTLQPTGTVTPLTLTVSASAPASIIANSAGIASTQMKAATGNTSDYEMWINGSIVGLIGVAGAGGQLIGGSSTNDLCLTTTGATRFATGATHTAAQMIIDTTGAVTMQPNGAVTVLSLTVPSGQEAIIATGAGIASMEMRAASGFTADYEMWNNGVIVAFVGTAGAAGQLIGDSAANDLCIATTTAVRIAAGGSHTLSKVIVATNGAVTVNGPALATGPDITVAGGGGFYQSVSATIGLLMNSAGTDWGMVQNTSSNRWALAHGTSATALGTEVLAWTSANDLIGRGVDICKFKAANTSRTSTTTLTADPDMTYAIPVAGTYRYKADLYFTAAASGATPGINLQVGYTGTVSANAPWNWVGFVGGAATANGGPLVNGHALFSVDTFMDSLTIEGTFTCSTTGTLSINWAQQNSSASATTMEAPSSFTIEQLS